MVDNTAKVIEHRMVTMLYFIIREFSCLLTGYIQVLFESFADLIIPWFTVYLWTIYLAVVCPNLVALDTLTLWRHMFVCELVVRTTVWVFLSEKFSIQSGIMSRILKSYLPPAAKPQLSFRVSPQF